MDALSDQARFTYQLNLLEDQQAEVLRPKAEPLPETLTSEESLRIELDKSRELAPNPRPLKRKWALSSNADKFIVDHLTDELKAYCEVQSTLQRFHYAKHRTAMSMVLANLSFANDHSAQVLYSRRTNSDVKSVLKNPEKLDNRIIMRVIDFLADRGLIENNIGAANEYQNIKSWCKAKPHLVKMISILKAVAVIHSKKAPLIVLRDDRKAEKPIPKHNAAQCKAKQLKEPVRAFNRFWIGHKASRVTARTEHAPVIPYLHRVFNLNLDLGGRFYGDYQTLPQSDRARIKIDDRETVELDYSALHINLLYAQEGIQFFGDANSIPGMDRELAKDLILRLLNSDNLGQFKANVTRSASPETKKIWIDWHKRIEPKRQWIEGKVERYRKPNFLEGFIEGVPEGLTGDQALEMIRNRHKPIAHHFGTDNIGLKLQNADSEIMSKCLLECLSKSLPALPVHDSIICQRRHRKDVERIMQNSYAEATNGFKIRINSK